MAKTKSHFGVYEISGENAKLLRTFGPDFNEGHPGKLKSHTDPQEAAKTLVANLTRQHKEEVAAKNASQNRRKGDEKNPLLEPWLSYEVRPIEGTSDEDDHADDEEGV